MLRLWFDLFESTQMPRGKLSYYQELKAKLKWIPNLNVCFYQTKIYFINEADLKPEKLVLIRLSTIPHFRANFQRQFLSKKCFWKCFLSATYLKKKFLQDSNFFLQLKWKLEMRGKACNDSTNMFYKLSRNEKKISKITKIVKWKITFYIVNNFGIFVNCL